jgi:hypothetical protein
MIARYRSGVASRAARRRDVIEWTSKASRDAPDVSGSPTCRGRCPEQCWARWNPSIESLTFWCVTVKTFPMIRDSCWSGVKSATRVPGPGLSGVGGDVMFGWSTHQRVKIWNKWDWHNFSKRDQKGLNWVKISYFN